MDDQRFIECPRNPDMFTEGRLLDRLVLGMVEIIEPGFTNRNHPWIGCQGTQLLRAPGRLLIQRMHTTGGEYIGKRGYRLEHRRKLLQRDAHTQ